MAISATANLVCHAPSAHQLRFTSLFDPGRGVVVPCDEAGHVDLDLLSDRLRNTYLWARAMVGREYGLPTVEVRH